MVKMSKSGSLSYNELRSLDVYEFFLVLTNIERQNEANKK